MIIILLLLLLLIVIDVIDGARLPTRRSLKNNRLPDLSQKEFPHVPDNFVYDLLVLGSGVAGESIAVRSAQLNKRVAIIERKALFGGPTGLTSKAVREACKRVGKICYYNLKHTYYTLYYYNDHYQYSKSCSCGCY